MFQIRVRKIKCPWENRFVIPSAELLGKKNYYCCHTGEPRTLFRVEVTTKTQKSGLTNYAFTSAWHPSCCLRPWARAVFYLAVRATLKDAIPDKQSRTICWKQLVMKLEGIIPVPDISDFYDIKKEGTNRRDAKILENREAEQRLEAAKIFANKRSSNQSELPRCFEILGFKTLPTIDVLRKRFLQLARETHPDMMPHELKKNEFKRYREAYEEAVEFLGNDS